MGKEGQGQRGSTATTLGPTLRVQVSRTSLASQLSPNGAQVPLTRRLPAGWAAGAYAALRLQDRRTTCGWPAPPVGWVPRWAPSWPSTPGARRLNPRPAHPPPRMSQPRLRTDPCRPGRGRLRVPDTSDRRQGHLGHPSSKEGKVPGLWSASPGEPAPVTPSLTSATSRLRDISGPRSVQQQFGAVRASPVDSGPGAPSSGPGCAVGNRLSSLQPSFPLPSQPPPRPGARLPYGRRGRSPPLP